MKNLITGNKKKMQENIPASHIYIYIYFFFCNVSFKPTVDFIEIWNKCTLCAQTQKIPSQIWIRAKTVLCYIFCLLVLGGACTFCFLCDKSSTTSITAISTRQYLNVGFKKKIKRCMALAMSKVHKTCTIQKKLFHKLNLSFCQYHNVSIDYTMPLSSITCSLIHFPKHTYIHLHTLIRESLFQKRSHNGPLLLRATFKRSSYVMAPSLNNSCNLCSVFKGRLHAIAAVYPDSNLGCSTNCRNYIALMTLRVISISSLSWCTSRKCTIPQNGKVN